MAWAGLVWAPPLRWASRSLPAIGGRGRNEDDGIEREQMGSHRLLRPCGVAAGESRENRAMVGHLVLARPGRAHRLLVDQRPERVQLDVDQLGDDVGQQAVAASRCRVGMEAQPREMKRGSSCGSCTSSAASSRSRLRAVSVSRRILGASAATAGSRARRSR